MEPKYTPNDVIGMLLQIAFKAEKLVATSDINPGPVSAKFRNPVVTCDHDAYRDLADELGVLMSLPFDLAQGEDDGGALRAKHFLKSFEPVSYGGKPVQPVNEVFAVRTYDDRYVEQLQVMVADISSDGRRFRACAHLFALANSDDEQLQHDVQDVINEVVPIAKQLESYIPSLVEVREIIDRLVQRGLIADDTAPENNVNLFATWEVMRQDALNIARMIVEQYREPVAMQRVICKHCCAVMPDDENDTLSEQHAGDCVVNKARQFIEDTDVV